ncbi:transglutaminase-like cysteine peptidase [Chitinilyticum litopenaei]|uniref:transglutaminase-like cysteine peptidase n=1 Tax=Chitinilyticum litopenaei TaxID=1121276 RepID=UPI000423CFE4|nr:transglutaminase-like cysteine peptidase [Chitinilyticum litopenaei]
MRVHLSGRPVGPLLLAAALLLGALALLGSAAGWDNERIGKLMAQRHGNQAARSFDELDRVISASRTLADADKLKRINEFLNRKLRFDDDDKLWGQADYWASLGETLAKGAGDCEDFVIAKFVSLREAGIAPEKLRLTYVKARIGGANSSVTQAHMVLAYYANPEAEPLILDNLLTDIKPASARPDLNPVFSFNSEGIFTGGAKRPSAGVDRLSRWKDLLLKLQAEGID